MGLAVAVALAMAVAESVSVGFIGFGAIISKRRGIQCFPI